jgi:hypothetical protein
VFVDDIRQGEAPVDVVELEPGAHELRVVGAFGERKRTIDVVAGTNPEITVSLPGVSERTLRALPKRFADSFTTCASFGREPITMKLTASPTGAVTAVVAPLEAYGKCVAVQAARWHVDPFVGDAVTVTVNVNVADDDAPME